MKIVYIILKLLMIYIFLIGCGSNSKSDENSVLKRNIINNDKDGDFIPDDIEIYLKKDENNSDENKNSILDGLEGDILFKYQWHLYNTGQKVNAGRYITYPEYGNDLGILDIHKNFMGYNHGKPLLIQVTDSGVQKNHEDLNVSEFSYNVLNHTNNPTASQGNFDDRSHGTMVAGVIASKAFNQVGGRGISPFAHILANNWLEGTQTVEQLEKLWYTDLKDTRTVVSNNSWGNYVFTQEEHIDILEKSSKELRGGKGVVFVFAGGNEREEGYEGLGNTNLSYLTSNRYVVTVASITDKNKYASYSNPGASLLVSAYGGEKYYDSATITTTTLSGLAKYTYSEDTHKNYTYTMNGTSVATPMVSGIIALTLEACPNLSYRDIKWLIANTAKKIDADDINWHQNSYGLWFNVNYGFGLIDGKSMIEICTHDEYSLLNKELYITKKKLVNKSLLDTHKVFVESIYIDKNINMEWVGFIIDSTHTYTGDLQIELESPSGTKSKLMLKNGYNDALYLGGFKMSSNEFMAEQSKGLWKLYITDLSDGDSGKLISFTLDIYGH